MQQLADAHAHMAVFVKSLSCRDSPERRLIGSRQRVVLLDELLAVLQLLCLQKAV